MVKERDVEEENKSELLKWWEKQRKKVRKRKVAYMIKKIDRYLNKLICGNVVSLAPFKKGIKR